MLDLALAAAFLGSSVEAVAVALPQVAVATRTSESPAIDGNLSDPVWSQAVPITDFTQQAPDEGQPSSQRTEVRILFDDRAIYFAFRCFDTDPKTIVANMTRFPVVKALWTFAPGGTFLMTAENDRRVIGPGHGVWTQTGPNQFGITFIRMRFDPDTAAYIGTLKVRTTLRVSDNGQELSGDYDSDFFDRDGHLTGPAFAGSIEGRRIEVEPLD